jgi:hypothetical protein
MRAVNLAKVAARAEILRLKHTLKRQAMRVVYGLVAVVFAIGVLVLANVAAWQVLQMYMMPIYATLVLLGINLLIATIFGIVATRSSPSRIERDALAIRRKALQEAQASLALGAALPLAGALLRSRGGTQDRRRFWRRLG